MRDIDKSREQLVNELVKMRQRVAKAEVADTGRKQTEHNLQERVKELKCLYGITEVAERPDITSDELYQEVVNLLPSSCQYPEITGARIIIDSKEFKTKNYRDTQWQQSSDIKVHGAKAGTVEVGYLEERPEIDEGPFLKEERQLIDAIAERLGRITERMRAEQRVEHLNFVLSAIRNVNQLIVKEKNRDRLLKGTCDNLVESCGYYNAWVAILDDSGNLVTTAEAGLDREFSLIVERLKRGEFTHCARRVLRQSDMVLIKNPPSTCGDCPLAESYQGRGAMAVRLEHSGKVYGILSVSIPVEFTADKEEQALLKEVAGDIAFALHSIDLEEKRKQAEEALQESEERYRALFRANADGVLIADSQTKKFVFANPVICQMLGYSEGELTKLGVGDIHPKDNLGYIISEFEAHARGEKVLIENIPCLRKDGQIIYVDVKSTTALVDGRKVNVGFFRDITERKQAEEALRESEERYRDLFENASDLVQSVAPDGKFRYVNRAWREILGYSEEEVASLTLWDIIHPDSMPHCQEIFQKVISGEAVSNIEAIFVAKDGKLVSVEGNANCRFEGGKPVSTRGIFHDVTERKQAQQAQERLNQQLRAKVSELETFSYAVAHDLRSPLVSIKGFVGLLEDDIQNQDTERIGEDIRLIGSGVRKMGQLLEETLTYSHSGRMVKPAEDIPFGEIVEEALGQFAELVRSIGATISLAETFPRVYVDRMRIKRVLTNLIQNSIAYRDKTRLLTIEIGSRLSEGEVVFFVRDNGIGIDASETEKVFDLFYRGTAESEGSGAGLAIVKRIIEAHEGRIWIEGKPGEGTTMCFTLPRQSSMNNGG